MFDFNVARANRLVSIAGACLGTTLALAITLAPIV